MHRPVLLQEAVDGLDLKDGEVFVDATYGAGGHTKEVLKRLRNVRAITIDQDPAAQANITGNFRNLDKLLVGVRPDAILFDLGFSSDQIESSERGFSFLRDEPLDMRMSKTGITAAEILNSFDESAIELILKGFGEERYSRKIARAIVESRPLHTTFDLTRAVEKAVKRRGKTNPATKTFQAIRIAVNEELSALEEGLAKAWQILKPEGRIAVISFHSLEDRMVKNFAKEKTGKAAKPIIASQAEIKMNPRARSAKLRVIKKK